MVAAIRNRFIDKADDLAQKWLGVSLGGIARNVTQPPTKATGTVLRNGIPVPGESKPYIYYPDPVKESVADRFTKGIGIGWSEGSKEGYLKQLADGTLKNTGERHQADDAGYLGYGLSVLQDVYDYANGVVNEAAWLLGKKRDADKLAGGNIDTAYGPLRQESLRARKLRADGNANFKSDLPGVERDIASELGLVLGRLGADAAGFGTRKYFWNMNPEDFMGTYAGRILGSPDVLELMGLEHTNGLAQSIRAGTAIGLGLGVGNWNPLNLAEGGRPAGFEAVSADENDPRKSTQPVVDLLVSRGLLGRNGRILPWEQFTQERPDVTYAEYQAYKDYLYNRDPGLLNKATLGLVKGTPEGIDGESPELRILGYRVTPEGIVTAGIGAAVPIAWAKGMQALNKMK